MLKGFAKTPRGYLDMAGVGGGSWPLGGPLCPQGQLFGEHIWLHTTAAQGWSPGFLCDLDQHGFYSPIRVLL